MDISLREVQDGDLPVYWDQWSDPELQRMAAATSKYHYDKVLFDEHWAKVRADPSVLQRAILADGAVAGHVAAYGPPSEREVTYAVGRPHWGRGIATAALAALLKLEPTRPLYAYAAADNSGSIRVLEKCGFTVTGTDRAFALARGEEIDEVHLTLDRPTPVR